jgi:MYXO-CTERM domain-containing protein
MRVCVSGVCDKDNLCGYADGDGPCSSDNVCRSDDCDTTSMTCVSPDAGMGTGGGGTDAGMIKLPFGAACTTSEECVTNNCTNGVCSEVVGSGNGIFCSVRADQGSGEGEGALGVFGLMLAAAGLRRRRGERGC